MSFDIRDLSILFSPDILMEIESSLYQEQPRFVDTIWPKNNEFANVMHKFLFQTEVSYSNNGYRILHPMNQILKCPTFIKDEILNHLQAQTNIAWTPEMIEAFDSVMSNFDEFSKDYIVWLQQQEVFKRCFKSYEYLCGDSWTLCLVAFAPDFVDGPFFDYFSMDISDELIHSMSMFQMTQLGSKNNFY